MLYQSLFIFSTYNGVHLKKKNVSTQFCACTNHCSRQLIALHQAEIVRLQALTEFPVYNDADGDMSLRQRYVV